MVMTELQVPEVEPMSWRNTEPTTPGAKAVALMRARNRVENAVAAINLAKTDELLAKLGYEPSYRELSDAALALAVAQQAWDLHKATRADAELRA